MALFGFAQFFGEFAAMQKDGHHASLLLVPAQCADTLKAELTQRPQWLLLGAAAQPLGHLFRRQAHLVEHFVEQVSLVLEMPVHRATRHASVTGDLVEAGVRHALVEKQSLGGGEQGDSGLFGVFFGSSHGRLRQL